jgi:hypothetical protein
MPCKGWEGGQNGHLQGVRALKAWNLRKGYKMKGQKAMELNVKLNLSHMELPIIAI